MLRLGHEKGQRLLTQVPQAGRKVLTQEVRVLCSKFKLSALRSTVQLEPPESSSLRLSFLITPSFSTSGKISYTNYVEHDN